MISSKIVLFLFMRHHSQLLTTGTNEVGSMKHLDHEWKGADDRESILHVWTMTWGATLGAIRTDDHEPSRTDLNGRRHDEQQDERL
ncbi:hypothetical protein AB0J28_17150 [Streptosporangium canum]|uniref:hypothetical protein n=1 Tax=Streptosporangium canum TaxID=324952 RepID=UPI0034253286